MTHKPLLEFQWRPALLNRGMNPQSIPELISFIGSDRAIFFVDGYF